MFPNEKSFISFHEGYLFHSSFHWLTLIMLVSPHSVSHKVYTSSLIDQPAAACGGKFWIGGHSLARSSEVEQCSLASTFVQRIVFGKRHTGPCTALIWTKYAWNIDCMGISGYN